MEGVLISWCLQYPVILTLSSFKISVSVEPLVTVEEMPSTVAMSSSPGAWYSVSCSGMFGSSVGMLSAETFCPCCKLQI